MVIGFRDGFKVGMSDLTVYIHALDMCTPGVGGNLRERSPNSTQTPRLKSQIDVHLNMGVAQIHVPDAYPSSSEIPDGDPS